MTTARWLAAAVVSLAPVLAYAQTPPAEVNERMLGVLPNFLTTSLQPGEAPLTDREKFRLAVRTTFDVSAYPLVGAMAAFNRSYGPGLSGYGKQYAASFADDVTGNLLTSAVMPSLLGQDPRYYRRGHGSIGGRVAWAASRVVVAYGDSGRPRVNGAELLGGSVAAAASNLYYPRDQRTVRASVERFAYQVMWDALANELKEFWPDVSRLLRGRGRTD